MKYFVNTLVTVCLLFNLNSCSENLKSMELEVYTFGNEIKANDYYPQEIIDLVQPFDDFYFSKVKFEDKLYGWKGTLDLENFSQLNSGLSKNKNGCIKLLKRFFDSTDETKKPDKSENYYFLYKSVKKTITYNYSDFINKLRNDSSKIVITYSDEEDNDKNNFSDIKSMREFISKSINNDLNKNQKLIILFKPNINSITGNVEVEDKPRVKTVNADEADKADEADNKTNFSDTNSKYNYSDQIISLTADYDKFSWNNFYINGKNIKYRVVIKKYKGHDLDKVLFESTKITNKYFKFSDCINCMNLPQGSFLLFTVELNGVKIGSCKFEPTSNSISNCHCSENKITASKFPKYE
jgi:hypothetical protein